MAQNNDLKLEDLSQSDIEFLNKIPIGTLLRVKKDEISNEIQRLPESEKDSYQEVFDKVKGGSLSSFEEFEMPNCRGILGCCHSTCNCGVWG